MSELLSSTRPRLELQVELLAPPPTAPARRLLRRAPPLVGGVLLLVPLSAVVASPIVPAALRVLLAALGIAAAVMPIGGIAALAFAVPFGGVLLAGSNAALLPYTESMVLAALAGLLVATAWHGEPDSAPPPGLAAPAWTFAAAVVASLVVVLAISEVGLETRRLFVSSFVTYLTRYYLLGGAGQWPSVVAACHLLEGVLLAALVARVARRAAARWIWIPAAVVASATLAAAWNVWTLAATLQRERTLHGVVAQLLGSRISVQVGDVNAAGSYFAMAGFLALGCWARTRRSAALALACGAASALIAAALWLTGSRTAVIGAVALGAVALATERDVWRRHPAWSIGVVTVIAAAIAAFLVGFDPRAVAGRSLSRTMESRTAFLITGVRMMASAPVFGVGVGRYLEMSGRFMPSSIYWFFFHENAHNNFLQIGGELGLVGLGAFLWLLVAAGRRIVSRRGGAGVDRLAAGAAAGLGAYVATWLTGHPLLVPEMAFPFWIVGGAALGAADARRRAAAASGTARTARAEATPRASILAALIVAVLAASVPFRVSAGQADLDLGQQTFGFYEWEGLDPATRTRWASPIATLFLPAQATEVDIPLHTLFAARRREPTVVSVAIGGRVFDRLVLTDDAWRTVRLRLPPPEDRSAARRIDIITTPAWSPAELLGGADSRVLGVQLREVSWR